MKIMVIGSSGQLGGDLCAVLGDEDVAQLSHDDIEITDSESIAAAFEKYRPQAVINTAAYHNVPKCEDNDLEAFRGNCLGPKYLAQNCQRYDSILVQISTDYVFDGQKNSPYLEDDLPHPLSVYGITKLSGEFYVQAYMRKYFIVRTSGLYGLRPCRAKGGNFIDTMFKLALEKKEIKVVGDEILTPTYTYDLALQIKELIKTNEYGLFHATSEGYCSWYEFAQAIFELAKMQVSLKEVRQEDFPSVVKRPHYSVLENARLKSLGINNMRHWKESLADYLQERKKMNLL